MPTSHSGGARTSPVSAAPNRPGFADMRICTVQQSADLAVRIGAILRNGLKGGRALTCRTNLIPSGRTARRSRLSCSVHAEFGHDAEMVGQPASFMDIGDYAQRLDRYVGAQRDMVDGSASAITERGCR